MFAPLEKMPLEELTARHARCRNLLAKHAPRAQGLFVFGRVNLYYMTGHMADGLLWLPLEGDPILLVRRGEERARLESPLEHIARFRSYSQVPDILQEMGGAMPTVAGADKSGLSWDLAELLSSRLTDCEFIGADAVLAKCRAIKTDWELNKMRLAGARHHKGLYELLPEKLGPGMNEREISHAAWQVFFSQGHSGLMRMSGSHEIFLGHVCAGDSGNYPSVFNGPVGIRGEHPAIPFMGYAGKVWNRGEALTCDIGFCLEGYQTDKTQVYWPGPAKDIPTHARDAHQLCVDVQAFLAENLKPGAIPSELYAKAMAMVPEEHLPGFMALDSNKVIFLGHGIGLWIDEYPVLAKGFDEPLEEGMVMALEPKYGIPGLGMVGVENTFEVTDQGGVCITGREYDIVCLE